MLHFLRVAASFRALKLGFPCIFPCFLVNFPRGDGFEGDCLRHHVLFRTSRFPPRLSKGPQSAGSDAGVSVSAETFSGAKAIFGELSLVGEIPFAETETVSGRDSVRMCGYAFSPGVRSSGPLGLFDPGRLASEHADL
jgi:hypothetical protein